MKFKMLLIPTATLAYMAQFDLKNAIVRFKDGTAVTPKKLDIKIGDGNITFDELKPRTYTLDRGKLSQVRNGDQAPMDVSMDFIWEHLKSNTTTTVTPEDALKQRVGAASWVSSAADVCAPYSIDIEIWYDPTCQTDLIEQIILPEFRYEKLAHDSKAGMIKCTGKCNATEATITRAAQT